MAKEKLLLHICCAPCAVFPFRQLRESFRVTGFFYNPNIQPYSEYLFRQREVTGVARIENWDLVLGDYEKARWEKEIRGLEREPERGARCPVCFYMRLRKTFEYAAAHQFHQVATTLSISPHKRIDQINTEGEKLAAEFGIGFLGRDFKKKDGYKKTRELSRLLGIRHQNYCGCIYSRRSGDE